MPEGGRKFYEIARDTLGNGQRWAEIWRLNPRYGEMEQVPAGAQIRLPADARLGP